jgi:tetratricopeptide (TPR) repeat protein
MADPETESRIHDLEQKLAAMPGSRAFVALAEEYRHAERYDEALATLTRGLEAHPNYLSARIAVARLYQEMGDAPNAIAAFQTVLAADRQNLVAAKSLADLYRAQGAMLEALKKYKLYRALSADTDTDEVISVLERQLNAPPPPEVVSAPFEEPIPPPPDLFSEPAPDPPEEAFTGKIPASRTLADLYYDQGHFEDARGIYEKLAQAHPEDGALAGRLRELSEPRAQEPSGGNPPGPARDRRVAALKAWLARVRDRSAEA